MNETIGGKGGNQDRRRRMKITRQQKKKLELYEKERKKQQIEELEKKVGRLQKITLIKTLPIVITGTIFGTFYKNARSNMQKEENKKHQQIPLEPVSVSIEKNQPIEQTNKKGVESTGKMVFILKSFLL